jgi:hypothetical protein
MMDAARLKSQKRPTAQNPLGLKGPMAVTSPICRKHHIEAKWMAQAKVKNWPLAIDFDAVPKRVLAMREDLLAFFADLHNNNFYNDMLPVITKYGSLKASSSRMSFHIFGLLAPG